MHIIHVLQAGTNYEYTWPGGDSETYPTWIEYQARANNGTHTVRIGFGTRPVYGQMRPRIVVWIDGHPHAEFLVPMTIRHPATCLQKSASVARWANQCVATQPIRFRSGIWRLR